MSTASASTLSAVATPSTLVLSRVPRTLRAATAPMIANATPFFPKSPSGVTAATLSPAATARVATLPLAMTRSSVQPYVKAVARPNASRMYAYSPPAPTRMHPSSA